MQVGPRSRTEEHEETNSDKTSDQKHSLACIWVTGFSASPSLAFQLASSSLSPALILKQQKMFSVNRRRKYSRPALWLMYPCVTVGFNFALH